MLRVKIFSWSGGLSLVSPLTMLLPLSLRNYKKLSSHGRCKDFDKNLILRKITAISRILILKTPRTTRLKD